MHCTENFYGLLVQDAYHLKCVFHLFVEAVKHIFMEGDSHSTSDTHPFVRYLIYYIEIGLEYIFRMEDGRQFINVSQNNLQKN